MNKTLLIIILLMFLFIILALVLFLLYFSIKSRAKSDIDVIELIKNAKKPNLKQINDFLKSKTASKNDLNIISEYFLANFKLPIKSDKITNEANEQLNFIKYFAGSKNADAKMISALNAALKKLNPGYQNEIDEMEKSGIQNRN